MASDGVDRRPSRRLRPTNLAGSRTHAREQPEDLSTRHKSRCPPVNEPAFDDTLGTSSGCVIRTRLRGSLRRPWARRSLRRHWSARCARWMKRARRRGDEGGHTVAMVFESVHVSTTIDRPAGDVYDFVSNPLNLTSWAAGLARRDVHMVDAQWVVDSPMGRVVVAFAPPNDFGILDHEVTLPAGETVHNPMRVIPNGDGCDVVFTVRRRPGMSENEFTADVTAVTADLAALRTLMER